MVKRINTQQIASTQVFNTAKLSLFFIFDLNIQANQSRSFLTGFPKKSYNEDSSHLKVVLLSSIHVAIALEGCNVYNSTSIGMYYIQYMYRISTLFPPFETIETGGG